MPSTFTTGDLSLEKPEAGTTVWKPIEDSNKDNIDTAVSILNRRIGGAYASVVAIKAITAANRTNGMMVLLTNSTPYTAYRFHASDVSNGDDDTVLVPDTGTGRWRKYSNLTNDQILALDVAGANNANKFATESSVEHAAYGASVPDAATLKAIPTANIGDFAIRYVSGLGAEYRYIPTSTVADDGASVLRPNDNAGDGRWEILSESNPSLITRLLSTLAVTSVNDVFLYETSLDSDGGAWRELGGEKSWFKEYAGVALNRGAKDRFPSTALLVAGDDFVHIYDLDGSTVNLWMKFTKAADDTMIGSTVDSVVSSVRAKNGFLYVGCSGLVGELFVIDFVKDTSYRYNTTASYASEALISLRNQTVTGWRQLSTVNKLTSPSINGMHVFIKSGTEDDPTRNLSQPTVAMATLSGVDVLLPDGTVVNMKTTAGDDYYFVTTGPDEEILAGNATSARIDGFAYPYTTRTFGGTDYSISTASTPPVLSNPSASSKSSALRSLDTFRAMASASGLALFNKEMADWITQEYQTGWMVGDPILAIMNMTDVADLGVTDRSGKTNNFTSNGTITKEVVNTGCTLVAYKGFNSLNFMNKAYDTDFDLGTDDFAIQFWLKEHTGQSSLETIAIYAYYTSSYQNSGWKVYVGTDGKLHFEITNDGFSTSDKISSSRLVRTNEWISVVLTRKAGVLKMFINGALETADVTITNAAGTLTNGSATILIGLEHTVSNALSNGTLSLLRIGKTTITEEQAALIFLMEKYLFSLNSKAGILGNDITAMDFDDSTQQLYVSTSAGLSILKGCAVLSVYADVAYQSLETIALAQRTTVMGSGTSVYIDVPQKDLKEEITKFQGVAAQLASFGGGGSGTGDSFSDDGIYATLLGSTPYNELYFDIFNAIGTILDGTASYNSAEKRYDFQVGQYIIKEIVVPGTAIDYKFYVHLDTLLSDANFQVSYDVAVVSEGAYSGSFTNCNAGETIYLSGGFYGLKIKITSQTAEDSLNSFGVLYDYLGLVTYTSNTHLYEDYVAPSNKGAGDVIVIPHSGAYTKDGKSLEVYHSSGLRYLLGNHYTETNANSITLTAAGALLAGEVLTFREQFGYTGLSDQDVSPTSDVAFNSVTVNDSYTDTITEKNPGSGIAIGSAFTPNKRDEGVVVKVNATNPLYQVDIDADFLTVYNTAGLAQVLSAVNLTADITVSGVNGLDTGAEAVNSWYYIWVIWNGTTTASLLSISSTAPTMPSGYLFKRLVGAVRNTSSNFIRFHQIGNHVGMESVTVKSGITAAGSVSFSSEFTPQSITHSIKISVYLNADNGGLDVTTDNDSTTAGNCLNSITALSVGTSSEVQTSGEIIVYSDYLKYYTGGTVDSGSIYLRGYVYKLF
ncbi:MAG: LamG domain-containing protein [SAR324 cluster bacterium]|nr:LamG domain-containing protein [SAR324 cluster bacterium]